eukprot:3328700-Pleurochrysis_carterae.AAC.1
MSSHTKAAAGEVEQAVKLASAASLHGATALERAASQIASTKASAAMAAAKWAAARAAAKAAAAEAAAQAAAAAEAEADLLMAEAEAELFAATADGAGARAAVDSPILKMGTKKEPVDAENLGTVDDILAAAMGESAGTKTSMPTNDHSGIAPMITKGSKSASVVKATQFELPNSEETSTRSLDAEMMPELEP